LWTYGNLEQVIYEYTPTRSREGPEHVLKDYKGYLQTDGFQAYNEIGKREEVVHLGCWAHVRRKFFEIKDKEPVHTEKILNLIQGLFRIESGNF